MRMIATLKGFSLVLLIIYIKCIESAADPCTDNPVAEGTKRLIISQFILQDSLPDNRLQWKFKAPNGLFVTVIECDVERIPAACHSSLLSPDYSGSVEKLKDKKGYQAKLIINKVTRRPDQTLWTWSNGLQQQLGECDLLIYSFQSEPDCNDVTLSSNNEYVLWRCVVNNVYPDKLWHRFEYRKENSDNYYGLDQSYSVSSIETRKGENPPASVYHDYTVTLTFPVSKIGNAGTFVFGFVAALDLNTLGQKEKVFKPSAVYKELSLVAPQAELSNCPNPSDVNRGYIKKGTTRTCLCQLKVIGVPPGAPQWLTSAGALVGKDVRDRVRSLSLQYTPKGLDQTYTCVGVSALGKGENVLFTPLFAYGPERITLALEDITDSSSVNCEGGGASSFYALCDTPIAEVNPEPTIELKYFKDGRLVRAMAGGLPDDRVSGHYRRKFIVTPQEGGNLTVTCLAHNSVFPDLTTESSKTKIVQSPPTSRPAMSVINGRIVSVENGGTVNIASVDTVTVKCRVEGGYPLVSRVTLTCGGQRTVKEGVEAVQKINLVKGVAIVKCRCEADHATGCYGQTSDISLSVHNPPTVTSFKANSIESILTVAVDTKVKFECDAEGNPRPSVSVIGKRSQKRIQLKQDFVGEFGVSSSGTRVMTCKDTDVFVCMLNNVVGIAANQTVSVFVECGPQLAASFEGTTKEFLPTSENDLEVRIPVYGHPPPSNYHLTKLRNTTQGRNRRDAGDRTGQDVDDASYQVQYESGQPPEGEVVLRMFRLVNEDSGHYSLAVQNGIGDGLNFEIYITVVPAETNAGDGESGLSTSEKIGIGVAAGVVLCVVCVLFGMRVQKNRLQKKERANTQPRTPSSSMKTSNNPSAPPPNPQRPMTRMNSYDLNILDAIGKPREYPDVPPGSSTGGWNGGGGSAMMGRELIRSRSAEERPREYPDILLGGSTGGRKGSAESACIGHDVIRSVSTGGRPRESPDIPLGGRKGSAGSVVMGPMGLRDVRRNSNKGQNDTEYPLYEDPDEILSQSNKLGVIRSNSKDGNVFSVSSKVEESYTQPVSEAREGQYVIPESRNVNLERMYSQSIVNTDNLQPIAVSGNDEYIDLIADDTNSMFYSRIYDSGVPRMPRNDRQQNLGRLQY